MSKFDDLLTQFAPHGVEFKVLSEICETIPGLSGKTKADFSDGNARYVTYKNAFNNLEVRQDLDDYVRVLDGEKQNSLHLGDVVVTGSSESLDEVGMSSVVTKEPSQPLYLNSFCFALRFVDTSIFDPGFSKYLFRSERIRTQIKRSASGVTRINISKPRFLKVRVPVPPLEVQREIVRILDQFTQLEAELEAELEARRAQIEYYRRSLFDADLNVRKTSLGDIAEFRYGLTATAAESGSHRFVRITDIGPTGKLLPVHSKYVDIVDGAGEYELQKGDLLVARTGGTYGKTLFFDSDDKSVYASFLIRIRFRDQVVLPKYYWHFAQSGRYWYQANSLVSGGGQPQFNANALKQVVMPFPSIDRQKEVVRILDAFDSLSEDLSYGLPAELNARRQQYEYHRDKLLTFKELVA